MNDRRTALRSQKAVAACALFVVPTAAMANFFWPPALYFYGATVWWAVPAGLAAEWAVLLPFLRKSPKHLLKVVLLANLASAAIGLFVTWPFVFWETGVEFLVPGEFFAVVLVAVLIFALNVAIEYVVSVKWFEIARQPLALLGFVAANMASFVILVAAGFTLLRL